MGRDLEKILKIDRYRLSACQKMNCLYIAFRYAFGFASIDAFLLTVVLTVSVSVNRCVRHWQNGKE